MRSDQLKTDYINKLFAPESDDLVRIRESHGAKLGINIEACEGKILQLIIKMIQAKRVMEIGTLRAYSTVWMAEALPEDGKITSIEFNPEAYELSVKNVATTKSRDKIEILQGDAREVLKNINEEFDLVFIDANKAAYIDYLDWAEENLRPGGVIIGDNTFLFGHLTGEETDHKVSPNQKKNMQIFNERMANPDKYLSVILPTAEGMTVAIKL